MNWFQKTSQSSWSDMSDELGTAQDLLRDREKIPQLKQEIGDIPKQTCPLIDKLIKQVNNIFGIIKSGPMYGDPIDALGDIESELWEAEDTLETIRSHNEQLRQLGRYWYEQYVATEENSKELENHLQYCQQMCQQQVSPSSHPWYL